ncbi:MAG TPA: 16S rRNA (adenine(1518)-N(6)/adenine(1519)-N(6))-dimethyltransferase RsmA [Bacteroidales bacterium]|nr:16S rRNA (adenine(1518)-N(6)/adenine(1519)-N(6))-dimethyltransferase RsmA [Bacteroidales bacterium]
MKVQPKKSLGQHFLKDSNIAGRIAGTLSGEGYDTVLEIGPGMGMLTGFLLQRGFRNFSVIEIDNESVHYLKEHFPDLDIICGDFLTMDLNSFPIGKLAIIGNFPYNISSQIFFRVLEYRDKVIEVAGMLQKEVAERICAGPGSKTYGILSVLLQAYYNPEYLFTVPEHVFSPPPKVKSGVIRLKRNDTLKLKCDEKLFFRVIKAAFNQRRKTLRNSIRSAFLLKRDDFHNFNLRPEQMSVDQFVELTVWISENSLSE